jgi:hypothetical protein
MASADSLRGRLLVPAVAAWIEDSFGSNVTSIVFQEQYAGFAYCQRPETDFLIVKAGRGGATELMLARTSFTGQLSFVLNTRGFYVKEF